MRQRLVTIKNEASVVFATLFATVIVGMVVIVWGLSCRKGTTPADERDAEALDTPAQDESGLVSPPDLNACTRLEVKYWPSTLKAVCVLPREEALLNPAEKQFLDSLTSPLIIDDVERIRAFAESIAVTSYIGPFKGPIAMKPITYVVCYRDDARMTSLRIAGPDIHTEDGERFAIKSNEGLAYLTAETAPFEFRVNCARNLWKMWNGMQKSATSGQGYPAWDAWCDVLVRHERLRRHIGTYPVPWLTCPSAGEGHSHYAMNPNCTPNSPGAMVLLFEAKAGWNQYGGAELFTFDNHEPKGGCVLLNDGTVKFIRT